MQTIEQTLDSREVAEMMDIGHWQLLRKLNGRTGVNGKHIKGYVEILRDNQVVVTDFFFFSIYKTEQNKEMPCYKVTKKGCEFLANKFTGEKGVLFTARYINKFHEMETALATVGSAEELAQLRTAIEAQGKMLNSINRKLSGFGVMEGYGRTMQDMYRSEIARMITFMNNEDALCKVYTTAKYVPQRK